jgi:hypothetical protein
MTRVNPPNELKFNLEISFTRFGEFVFREPKLERKEKVSTKEPAVYVFPKSTAALAEL